MAKSWVEPAINLVTCFVFLYFVLIVCVIYCIFTIGSIISLSIPINSKAKRRLPRSSSQGGWPPVRLSYCEFLLDSSTIGTDDVDTSDRNMTLDGLAWLDGEVSNGNTTDIDDTHISLMVEG